jgi:hypothetical protein
MLFVLTLGIITGIAGLTLVRQWLNGALASDSGTRSAGLTPAAFPHLAPPRRTATVYRLRRRVAM